MPLLCSTSLLFRRRLSESGHYVAGFRELATAGVMASACVHITGKIRERLYDRTGFCFSQICQYGLLSKLQPA
jgi:hypothetical protein